MIKTKHIFACVLAVVLIAAVLAPQTALAAAPFLFGGPILAIIPPIPFFCIFPAIVVGPPNPAVVAVVPGLSQIFAFFKLLPGSFVVGLMTPEPVPFCGFQAIIITGTSL